MTRVPPQLAVPQDVDLTTLDTRVIDLPRGLSGAVLGLLSLMTKTTYWKDDPFGATAEDTARAMSRAFSTWRNSVIPVATILSFIGEDIPEGFLLCDGTSHARVDFPDLFARIAPIYIIDANTFSLPDLRTRFLSGSPDSTVTGAVGGQNDFSLSSAQLPTHSHNYFNPTLGPTLVGNIPAIGVAGIGLQDTGFAGAGATIDNRPAFTYVEFIIRAIP